MAAGEVGLAAPLLGIRPPRIREAVRRPIVVALAVAIAAGVPTLLITRSAVDAAQGRLREAAAATHTSMAQRAAAAMAERWRALQGQVLSVAGARLLQVGAMRADQALLATVLLEFRPLVPDARSLHYVDLAGVQLAADPPSAAASQLVRRAAVAGAREPLLDDAAPIAAFAAVVRDGFGAQTGALVATLDLRDFVVAADLPPGIDGALVSPAARLLSAAGATRDAGGDGTVREILGGRPVSGVARDPVSGEARLLASAALPDGWHLLLAAPPPVISPDAVGALDLYLFRGALVAALAVAAFVIARALADLLHERRALAAANGRLAVATRHRTEFLANVNHELRTPLSTMLGFASLLEERTALDERQSRYVRNIREAGDHLLGLVDDILDLAAVETGRLALDRRPVDIRELLARPLEVARVSAEARDLRLEVAPLPVGRIDVDVERLGRALALLLASACDATPAGGTVGVSATLWPAGLVIAVADGGPAVARERAARLFDVYGRMREGGAGPSGPGLALAKRLVELHGGALAVDGGDGSGTVITVRIPVNA